MLRTIKDCSPVHNSPTPQAAAATSESAAGLFLAASVVTTIGDMTLVLVLVLGLVLVLFAASLMGFLLHSRRLLFFFFSAGFRFGLATGTKFSRAFSKPSLSTNS